MIKLNKINQTTPIQTPNPYLQYLSTFKQLYRQPNEITDLHDGVILYQLFQQINGFVIVGEFDENPKTFSQKFSNLKVLFQSIQKYWNQHLQRQIQSQDIDKIQMAYNKTSSQIQKFLQLFVKTAINSINKDPFIQKMLQTSQSTQMMLKKVIQKTISPPNRESPRKQKQKRMIDKIIELDHQNQKLQNFISIICNETLEFEMKLKSLTQLLLQKNQEINKLQNSLYEYTLTPRKNYVERLTDTSQRKSNEIDHLKSQIADLRSIIQDYQNQRYKFEEKLQVFETTKAQLQLSQSIIQCNQSIIDQVQSTQNSLNQSKAEIMNQNNHIAFLKSQLDKSKATITELQRKQINLKAELERKNIQISQLKFRIEKPSTRDSEGRHNLYLQFPEIVNTEANAYIQINKSLRQELERSRFTLLKTVAQLQKTNADNQRLKRHEEQNKKLKKMILEEKNNKGEEISLLVNALYHLRKQVKENSTPMRKTLQPKNV